MQKVERYLIGKELGHGAYAVVKIGYDKIENKKIAMKVYDKMKNMDIQRKKSIRREIKILQRLNHQGILKILDAFDTQHHVYVVTEYIKGPSLHSYLKTLKATSIKEKAMTEEEAKMIFR